MQYYEYVLFNLLNILKMQFVADFQHFTLVLE